MKKFVYLGFVLLLAACAGQPEIVKRIPFNPHEFAQLPTTGTATVTGQAFITGSDGRQYYPHGEQARLNPITSYSRQWYQVHYLDRKNIGDADPRYLEYVYKAEFTQQGRFTFQNIPAGDYYLSAPIFWLEEIKMKDGSILMKRQGAFICREIHVEEGKTTVTNITAVQAVNMAASG